MKCNNHPDKEAIAVCVSCKEFLCEDCKVKVNGRNYCKKCSDELCEVQKEYEPNVFESYVKNFISNFEGNTNSAKSRFDGFVKEKGIDKELQNFVSNVSEKGRSTHTEEPFDKIKRAKELLDIEAITDEEFQQLKYKYINQIINSNGGHKDPLIEIKKFKELLDMGTINPEEYEEIKKIYLDL